MTKWIDLPGYSWSCFTTKMIFYETKPQCHLINDAVVMCCSYKYN